MFRSGAESERGRECAGRAEASLVRHYECARGHRSRREDGQEFDQMVVCLLTDYGSRDVIDRCWPSVKPKCTMKFSDCEAQNHNERY